MPCVLKRNGQREEVNLDKILKRIESLADTLHAVDSLRVAQRVVQGVHDGVRTAELDALAAETAASLSVQHPNYALLAGRISVSRLHKETEPSMRSIRTLVDDEVGRVIDCHGDRLDAALDWHRDFSYDFFGIKTLERSYLLRIDNKVVERPQVLLMRVALGIHLDDLEAVLETYSFLSRGVFTHATPTMFNAGTRNPHLASCFLLPIHDDSIDGIFETNKRCAQISKSAGGIGFSVSNVRASGSRIGSTGGTSAGLLPMLRCFESTARYVDQGGGKRKGAFAAYLEPWHADVRTFLDMKKNHGQEELRARDLFYALWIPDLFMRRVEANGSWTLFCPSRCPDLVDLSGSAFDAAYEDYERTPGVAVATLSAQELWFAILDAQMETGNPYMLYKDACNAKSNQKHLGTIRCSNLCTEIVQYSSVEEIAVCNLGSLALPTFVVIDVDRSSSFDVNALAEATRVLTRNLNRIIDRNRYARPEAQASNLRHRPVGMGVQGLADVFALLRMPFDSPEARALNKTIFETIYYAGLDASCALAAQQGPYDSFAGSPASQGKLQYDLWDSTEEVETKSRWDWRGLKKRIQEHGLRNSLLVAPMPTASTAQILGNNECFEPFTSNLYVRKVLAGEFVVINRHLVLRLEELGLWSEDVRLRIVAANGSVQDIESIPANVKLEFRTAWEMSMRALIDQSADRGRFVDQSQSLNLFVADPTHSKLTSMHFYAWRSGLKTGLYYLRTKAAADAVKVAVPAEMIKACRRDDPTCEACSS